LKAGASGYLLKSSPRRELLVAIRAVHAGRRYVLAEVAHDIAVHAAEEQLPARAVLEDAVKAQLRSVFAKLASTIARKR
jgi:DNA-binding NarL/FixJ family response regulator